MVSSTSRPGLSTPVRSDPKKASTLRLKPRLTARAARPTPIPKKGITNRAWDARAGTGSEMKLTNEWNINADEQSIDSIARYRPDPFRRKTSMNASIGTIPYITAPKTRLKGSGSWLQLYQFAKPRVTPRTPKNAIILRAPSENTTVAGKPFVVMRVYTQRQRRRLQMVSRGKLVEVAVGEIPSGYRRPGWEEKQRSKLPNRRARTV